jgi:hypothetical protein
MSGKVRTALGTAVGLSIGLLSAAWQQAHRVPAPKSRAWFFGSKDRSVRHRPASGWQGQIAGMISDSRGKLPPVTDGLPWMASYALLPERAAGPDWDAAAAAVAAMRKQGASRVLLDVEDYARCGCWQQVRGDEARRGKELAQAGYAGHLTTYLGRGFLTTGRYPAYRAFAKALAENGATLLLAEDGYTLGRTDLKSLKELRERVRTEIGPNAVVWFGLETDPGAAYWSRPEYLRALQVFPQAWLYWTGKPWREK